MAVINLVSNQPGAGKTCLAGALAAKSCQMGRRVAYYKPLSVTPEADADVGFLAPLLEDSGSPQEGVPPPLSLPVSFDDTPARISEVNAVQVETYLARLESTFDLTIVDWEAPAPLSGSDVLLVFGCPAGAPPASVSSAIKELAAHFGDSLAGVVINNVPRHREKELMVDMVDDLREEGLPILGAIPEDRQMMAMTLRQVAEFLDGLWVEAPSDPERWVDRFLIGGNILDSGPNYLGRFPHQAVITRAARPDIQMASLMCNTRLLVLTEGEEPTEYIRVEAHKRDAALLLVPGNTLETAESLGSLVGIAQPCSRHKLARFTELAEMHLDGGLEAILP